MLFFLLGEGESAIAEGLKGECIAKLLIDFPLVTFKQMNVTMQIIH